MDFNQGSIAAFKLFHFSHGRCFIEGTGSFNLCVQYLVLGRALLARAGFEKIGAKLWRALTK